MDFSYNFLQDTYHLGSRSSPIASSTVAATITGDALKLVPVNRQASFNVEFPDGNADLSDVSVSVTGNVVKYTPN